MPNNTADGAEAAGVKKAYCVQKAIAMAIAVGLMPIVSAKEQRTERKIKATTVLFAKFVIMVGKIIINKANTIKECPDTTGPISVFKNALMPVSSVVR